jgi:hypothetical protein
MARRARGGCCAAAESRCTLLRCVRGRSAPCRAAPRRSAFRLTLRAGASAARRALTRAARAANPACVAPPSPRHAGELDAWRATPHTCVSLIVVLDQFSRHVYRRRGEPPGGALQAAADAAALTAAEALLAAGWEARLSVPEHIFALMPLRHNAALPRLQRALDQARQRQQQRQRQHASARLPSADAARCALRAAAPQAEARAGVEATHGALLERFRRATLRRLQEAQGKQWLAGDELLEHHPFAADEAGLLREPLAHTARRGAPVAWHAAAVTWLRTHLSVPMPILAHAQVSAFWARHAPEAAAAPRPPARAPPPPPEALPVRACVSLSGGVDSMVLALILSRLGAGRWRVVGAHIDYGNRPESGAEAAYVAAWCAAQGIVYRLQTMGTELRRGIAGRDAYERESRAVRYAFYADVLAEFPGCGGVCVGHHAGDIQENVITNLLKGTSLLGVAGMTEVSRVNGVPVWCAALCAVTR